MTPEVFKYAARHLAAGLIVIFISTGLLVLAYLMLLLLAIIFNFDLGSPVALPLWLFIVAASAALTCIALFMPATAIADAVARRNKWPLRKRFGVAVGCYVWIILVGATLWPLFVDNAGFSSSYASGLTIMFILLLPMTGYWMLVQFSGWTINLAATIYQRLRVVRISSATLKPTARPLYLNPSHKKPPSHS